MKIGAIRIPTNPSDPVKIDLTQLGVDPAEWEASAGPRSSPDPENTLFPCPTTPRHGVMNPTPRPVLSLAQFKKDPLGPTLHLLSDSGGELEVTGRVAARFSLKRPADEAAGVSYMVDRFKKAKERENVGVSVIREMEPEDGRIRGMGAFGGDWLRRHKDDMQLQRSAKEMVQRKSREELEMDVHAAFAKTRFWVLAQLQKYLKQPASAVNEVRRAVGVPLYSFRDSSIGDRAMFPGDMGGDGCACRL